MRVKFIISGLAAACLGLSASADNADGAASTGEALAWTVAAYASCDSHSAIQEDFREEVQKLKSSTYDILHALRILAEADNVCGLKNTYAQEMLQLAETNLELVEARLGYSEDPEGPVFAIEEPEGPGQTGKGNSVLVAQASGPPPPPASDPTSSDYRN